MNETTAILVIKGNPPYLERSLNSIEKYVDEIIIGTIDASEALINKLKKNNKIRIVPLESTIPFADVVKEKLKKMAKGKYILYFDPDEIFPKKAFEDIQKNIDKYDFFMIPRKNIIFGKWIEYSRWWPDYQLRFFKKNSVVWPLEIHPVPQTSGRGFSLPPTEEFAIEHYNYENVGQYLEKSQRYAKAEAKKAVQEKRKITLGETLNKSLTEFFSRYFMAEGYKDGSHGFVLAFMQMYYYVLVYVFYWEEMKYYDVDNESTSKEIQKFYFSGFDQTNYWLINKKLINKTEKIKIKFLSKIMSFFKL